MPGSLSPELQEHLQLFRRKAIVRLAFISLFSTLSLALRAQEKADLYLGMTPPGNTPQIFAPEVVSTEMDETLLGIFNSGRRIVFDRIPQGFNNWDKVPVYTLENGDLGWKVEESSVFAREAYLLEENARDGEVRIIPWWTTNMEGAMTDVDLLKVEFKNGKWSVPVSLGTPVNTPWFDSWPSVTEDGILYFFSNRPDGFGQANLYYSIPKNGAYSEVIQMDSTINFGRFQHDPCISADGKTLIYSSYNKESLVQDDLYVCYRQKDGSWSKPKNLGPGVNSEASDNRPHLTNDEKYLFFVSNRNGNLDIFWVSAEILEK